MAGVEIYRRQGLVAEWFQTPWHEGMEPFVALPAAEAAAIERVVQVAATCNVTGFGLQFEADLREALNQYAAVRSSTSDERRR